MKKVLLTVLVFLVANNLLANQQGISVQFGHDSERQLSLTHSYPMDETTAVIFGVGENFGTSGSSFEGKLGLSKNFSILEKISSIVKVSLGTGLYNKTASDNRTGYGLLELSGGIEGKLSDTYTLELGIVERVFIFRETKLPAPYVGLNFSF